MEGILKKLIAVLLALFCVMNVVSCAQSEQPADEQEPASPVQSGAEQPNAHEGETMLRQYSEELYPLPGGYVVKGVDRVGTHLLFTGDNGEETIFGLAAYEGTGEGRYSLSDTRLIKLNEPDAADEAVIYGATAGGDGYFYILTGNAVEETDRDYAILRYTEQGAFESKLPIPGWDKGYVADFHVDAEGKIILCGDSYVAVLTGKGELRSSADVEFVFLLSSALTDRGVIISGFTNNFDGGSPYYLVDSATGVVSRQGFSNPDYDGRLINGSLAQVQGLDGEFIINSGNTFILMDLKNDSYEELLRWSYSRAEAGPACRLGENAFICTTNTDSVLLTGIEEVPYVERSVVNVALVSNWHDMDEGVLFELNNGGGEYEYRATRYSEADVDRFLTELAAGNTPDLLLFFDNVNTDSSFFEDLYPYIDSDPDLSRESFLPNFLEALSSGGELHQLWERTEMNSLLARASDVGDGAGMKPEDYNRIAAENENYAAVFQSFIDKNALLAHVANMGIITCVDKENATCNFATAAFRDLLAWTKDMGADFIEGTDNGPAQGPDTVVLMLGILQRVQNAKAVNTMFGEPGVYVGYPDGEDGFHYFSSHADAGVSMAIPKNSRNKEGAWAFIKSRLSMEKQSAGGIFDQGIPVLYEAARRIAETELDETARSAFYDLLSKTKYAETYADRTLQDIIIECGQSYLSGDKSLADTVNLIQSRAKIYVAEQYA